MASLCVHGLSLEVHVIPGFAPTIFRSGMAPSNGASHAVEPLFPPVTGGLRGLAPDRVAEHQKARLEAAVVEAVARHGYAGTTLRELVRLAGVSKSTFYEHFDSKQECFLATFDEIVAKVTERVGAAYREQEGDFRERLTAALTVFMEIVVAEPAAATLTTVESLTLGAAGVDHRERASAAFEAMIRQSFEHSEEGGEVSDLTVLSISSGIRGVVYRRLRAGEQEQLPGQVEELVEWATGYQRPESEWVRRGMRAAAEPQAPDGEKEAGELDWKEPPDSARSRADLSQRERILRAVGQLVIEGGYESLSIPAISARAGTSNQTFYENFSNKRGAFLSAFDETAGRGLRVFAAAYDSADELPEAIGSGTRALLEHVAADELFARLAFFDLQTAGPLALDRADAVLDGFLGYLSPEASAKARPPAALDAVGAAAWSVVQREIVQGRSEELPELTPELTRMLLTPFAVD